MPNVRSSLRVGACAALLVLGGCVATHAPLASAAHEDGFPAFGNEATYVRRANRLAASDSYTCAVVGPRRELLCWGAIGSNVGPLELGSNAAVAERGKGPARRCKRGGKGALRGSRPAALWWAPELHELLIDPRGLSRAARGSRRPLRAVRQVVLRQSVGCALLVDGDAVCWQVRGTERSLDRDPAVTMADPLLREGLRGAGYIVSDGRTWCSLRNGAVANCFGAPQLASPLRHFDDIRDIWGDRSHSCMLRAGGAVFCWGDNDRGQLGVPDEGLEQCVANGTVLPCTEQLVSVPLANAARQVQTAHSDCALLADGTVQCWGAKRAPAGASRGAAMLPRRVPGLRDILQVALHGDHGCALGADGLVRCFYCSHLDRDSRCVTSEPRVIRPIEKAREIAVGKAHACAVLSDRSLWCWGNNDLGQLGDGSCENSLAPRQILPPHSISPPIVELHDRGGSEKARQR